MTTITGTLPTIPRYVTTGKPHPERLALTPARHTTTEAALRAILSEVTPGTRPYSTDSYLPAHLVQAAQTALDGIDMEATQHAHNAPMCASWHIARGEPAKALARLRRAQSHIKVGMLAPAATTNTF